MQGNICMPLNIETGSSPPHQKITDANGTMDLTTTESKTKEILQNQSNRTDSGFLSASNNTNYTGDHQSDSDNRSDCSSPEKKHPCPICDSMLTGQHELTLHIRSHNNDNETQPSDKGFVCKICGKVLCSSSSLDRHVLVHSGERPFSCSVCGVTFTTNGNMHRHMKKHPHLKNGYESDSCGSSDSSGSSSRKVEYNNNQVDKHGGVKRKLEEMEEFKNARIKLEIEHYKCQLCEREDFSSLESYKLHLSENHPEHPAECSQCKQSFSNHKALNLHMNTVHADQNGKLKTFIHGFKDCTHVDFSCEKFPHIAKSKCEEYIHKPASEIKFQCRECPRAFPCATSLEMHEKDCMPGTNHIIPHKYDTSFLKRKEFFNILDLQDNSIDRTPIISKAILQNALRPSFDHTTKDLADIPTILSMATNGSFMQHLSKNEPNHIEQQNLEKTDEEEAQDIFAIEFRKMKLRGEFPCRLCTAVFPNLRALKGHNRAHLNGNNNGTYQCNMCPYSSQDKSALVRHMRTHNGDRPYECSLCKYAFTTKANCERHLRNRHNKNTRDEVKNSIIYHPSEDPTNDDLNKLARDDSKKMNSSFTSNADSDVTQDTMRSTTPKSCLSEHFVRRSEPLLQLPTPLPWAAQPTAPYRSINDIITGENLKTLSEQMPSLQSRFPFNPTITNTSTPQKPKIHVKTLDTLKQIPEYDSDPDYDKPIDLSKKKAEYSDDRSDSEEEEQESPEDLTRKAPEAPQFNNILAQQIIKNHQLAMLQSFPHWPHPFPPQFLFPLLQDPERFNRPTPNPMMNENRGFPAIPQPMFPTFPSPKSDDIKPLSVNIDPTFAENISKMQSPIQQAKPEVSHSPNSVKMVIKNGVLMPKQKQRRYRTERPFACEHCSARFTLRSNMERHIKQQHPQYYSQRQRSNSNAGRKAVNGVSANLTVPTYEPQRSPEDDNKNQISDELKYAILAQHLRANQDYKHSVTQVKKEEDDECALVIDEHEEKMDTDEEFERRRMLEDKLKELKEKKAKSEEVQDLVSVSRLLDNASQQPFKEFFKNERDDHEQDIASEEDEEGLVASGSTSEANSGSDDKSESENPNSTRPVKKKSAYSLAPNRVSCPYCNRKFPWTSSLRRHILTHTGQKPFKCSHCPLLFTTKSNCDRHLQRKHDSAASTIPNDSGNNNASFLMRNVPERPYKCSTCPSSTFSTASNLKKHIHGKHNDGKMQGYDAGSSEDEKHDWEGQQSQNKLGQESQQANSSDLPFKCHLCEGSFSERNDCLDHIKDKHPSEYELLMSKNALDSNASPPEDSANNHDDEDIEIRGKFPDYSNRKVICAFCMRRFWSAEDLRRHMRTHTGERPFSCDICCRKFTLKHSMLRHRKKHTFMEGDNANSDEDIINPTMEKLKVSEKTDDSDANESGGDLISNLLGIQGSIVDQIITSTPDDAAKLLGVRNGNPE